MSTPRVKDFRITFSGTWKTILILLTVLFVCIINSNAQLTVINQCWETPTAPNPALAWATSKITVNPTTNELTIRVTYAKTLNNTTYGTHRSAGTRDGRILKDLYNSDMLEIKIFNTSNQLKFHFRQDMLERGGAAVPYNYFAAGIGGDAGALFTGSASSFIRYNTSIAQNLQTYYNSNPSYFESTSPPTDPLFGVNTTYPLWDYNMWYEVTLRLSDVGTFGSIDIIGMHNSPPMDGTTEDNNPDPVPCHGRIGNLVWNDLNRDGIKQPAEPGIAGVVVRLYEDYNNDNIPDGAFIATTTTSANGTYIFTGLQPNNYIVSILNSSIPVGMIITNNGTDPDNDIDNDNNGLVGSGSEIFTKSLTLTPYDEPNTPVDGDGIDGNLTVDFGLVQTVNLGNRVWYDQNNNGLQDSGEPNLSGVTVSLYADANGDNNPDGVAIASTVTNASGEYGFGLLAPGKYIVGVVIPSGYASGTTTSTSANPDNDVLNDNNGVRTVSGESRSNFITLTVGGEPTNDGDGSNGNLTLDFGLKGTGSIGDFVWNDYNGNGIQDTGEPGIAGVTVTLTYANGGTTTTTTAANGAYSFTNLAPGTYSVSFTTPTGFIASPALQGGNTALDSDPVNGVVSGIVLTAGQNNNTIDAGFKSNQLKLGDRVWNDLNNNGIQDAGEPGIANVSVKLYRDADANNMPDGASLTTVTTDASGLYQFTGLTPGNYIVGIVIPNGYTQGSTTASSSTPNNDNNTDNNGITIASGELRSNFITLTFNGEPNTPVDGDDTNGNLTLDFGLRASLGSISDFVWNDLNKNGVQDAGETGLAGVTVTLYNSANAILATTVTDAYGFYQFANLPTSAGGVGYIVRFSLLPGYTFSPNNGAVTVSTNSDADPTTGYTGNISLTIATPNVTYVDAGMYYTAPARLGDFVWNDVNNNGIQDAGEPGIAGVTVMLYTSADVLYRSTVTSNNGYYFFNEVAPGTYYVKVTPPIGYKASPKDATSDGADSDIDPVTFKTGNYTVVNGTNNLTIDAGFNVTPTTGASASLGDKVWEDLNNNNVQDAGEPGIPNVTVELYNSANVLQASTTTDAFGNYIFNGLTPGDYYVKFTLPSGFSYVTPYTGSDETKDSDVDGSNGAGTTGLVTVVADEINTTIDAGMRRTTAGANLGDFVWYDLNKNGVQDGGSEVGVPGITVILYNSANAVVKTTTTDINGFYLFTGLTASTAYTVGFENIPAGYGFSPNVGAVTVTNNSDVNPATGRTGTVTTGATGTTVSYIDAGLIITPNRFDSKSSIGDRVWNDLNNNGIQDNGEPRISGVTVTLYAFDGTTVVATTTTDALGNYLFTNLNAGTYVVGFTGLPAGYVFATKDAGSDDTKDSDVNSGTGKTDPFVIGAGEINLTIDAGARNTNTALSSIGNFVWYDVNGNGIQNSGEPGAAGISVSLLNSAGTVLKTTTTSAGGEYLFTDLAAGTYFVQFGNLPAGYTATTKNAAGSTAANNSDANTATLTTDAIVLPASTVDLNWDMGIVSATRASLGDFVWNDLDGNGRQDAGEPGVACVTVTLYNSSNVAVAQTVTDANGFYFFSNVLPGTYSVGFSTIPAASTFTVQNAAIATAATNSDVDPATGRTATFTLVGGQSKTDVDAGLVSYKASVGDYVWNDINKDGIQDAGEVGVAGVTVTMYRSTNATIGDGDDVAVASAVTDANGYYLINDVTVAAGGSQFYMRYTDVPTKYTSFTLPLVGGNGAANNSKVEDQDLSNGRTGFFSLSPNQIYRSMDAGIYKSINLSGHVWHDANGMADNLVNNSGALQTPPASQIPNLYAYLVNANTGLVEQVVDVDPFTNQYSFTNLTPNTNYQVIVTTAFQVIGGVAPPSLLPTSWLHTGQQLGLTPGNDGLNDGILEISVGEEDIIDANFGIRKRGNDIVTG